MKPFLIAFVDVGYNYKKTINKWKAIEGIKMKEYQYLIGAIILAAAMIAAAIIIAGAIDGAGSSICSSLFQLGGALR